MEQAEHAIIFYFLARILRLSPLSPPRFARRYVPHTKKRNPPKQVPSACRKSLAEFAARTPRIKLNPFFPAAWISKEDKSYPTLSQSVGHRKNSSQPANVELSGGQFDEIQCVATLNQNCPGDSSMRSNA
jgi:hypothetical protein